jgi:hypothetical protein
MPIQVRYTRHLADQVSLLYHSCPPTLVVNDRLWRVALPAERLQDLKSLCSGLAPYVDELQAEPFLIDGQFVTLDQLAHRELPRVSLSPPSGRADRHHVSGAAYLSPPCPALSWAP